MTFSDLSAEYCKAIVASLGSQLLSINWKDKVDDVDFALLGPCTQLEELEIHATVNCSRLNNKFIVIEDFLPKLKKLVSECCLVTYMLAFESVRPTLTEVRLNCAHFGACYDDDDDDAHPLCEWEDVPNRWPNLENFSLEKYNKRLSLNLNEMRDIFPRFKNLKSLILPIEPILSDSDVDEYYSDFDSWQEEEEDREREELVAHFWQLPSPIQLTFKEESHSGLSCDYVPQRWINLLTWDVLST